MCIAATRPGREKGYVFTAIHSTLFLDKISADPVRFALAS